MPEVVLDRPRILAVVGQLVPAAVAQHVAGDEIRSAVTVNWHSPDLSSDWGWDGPRPNLQ